MSRPILLLALCLGLTAEAHYKIIDLKSMPQKPAALTTLLRGKEKDPARRAAASLLLDNSLRDHGQELKSQQDAEAVLTLMLETTFAHMASANDVYGFNKDEFNPRADMLCKRILVLPGRVSTGYSHKFTNKIETKKADSALQGKTCDTTVEAAKTEDEFYVWVENQGWGLLPYEVMINDEGVTRGGFQFLSPGTTSYRAPRFEKPVYVGFSEKKDDAWQLIAMEPALVPDWRKQEANIYPPEANKVSEQEKRARVALWMESVRGVNNRRRAFIGPETNIFLVNGQGADHFDKAQVALFEPWLESEDLMVRAAAQIKYAQLGGGVTPASMGETMQKLSSIAARSELGKAIFRSLGASLDSGADAAKEDKAAIEKVLNSDQSPFKLGRVNWVKIYEDWAKVSVSNMPCSFFIFRQKEKDWVMLGPVL